MDRYPQPQQVPPPPQPYFGYPDGQMGQMGQVGQAPPVPVPIMMPMGALQPQQGGLPPQPGAIQQHQGQGHGM
jgi:hypothetical protein